MSRIRAMGLMSGTSLDGIDAAIVRFEGGPRDLRWESEAFSSTSYNDPRRKQIHDAIVSGNAAALCRLHADLGEWFAEAALELCSRHRIDPQGITVIGSHGQTVWHDPATPDRRGATLQLGCAATIAERTGIPVVSDFRSRDVAAGGQGAPLVPFADRLLYSAKDRTRILLNCGGMANLTRVPPRESDEPLLAFDTGPGNALIDAAVSIATQGKETYDRDGVRAAAGRVDSALLSELLADPFFELAPPRSTGREHFGRPFVEEIVARQRPANAQDWASLIATFTAFTAASVADAVRRWVLPRGADELVVTGGGASNPTLLEAIAHQLNPLPVIPGRAAGIDSDAKEAIAFAALAWAHILGLAGNFPEVTGAAGKRMLGSYTPGNR